MFVYLLYLDEKLLLKFAKSYFKTFLLKTGWGKHQKNITHLQKKNPVTDIGPINLLSDRLLRYILIFDYQILVLDLVVDIRTKISERI